MTKGILLSITLIGIILIASCKTIETYNEAEQPIFLSNNYQNDTLKVSSLKVVTFNIHEGSGDEEVVSFFNQADSLRSIDILLLQEADEHLVQKLSTVFKYNFIYFPIAKSRSGHNFGNAILTKHQIMDPRKLILPHEKINGRIRNATNCVIDTGVDKVLVYSIHNETIIMSKKKRSEQLDFIIEDIKTKMPVHSKIIVGGDFNCITASSLKQVREKFERIGFSWHTENIDFSSRQFMGLLKFRIDHIFSIGFSPGKSSKINGTTSSDHDPIMVYLN